ncbi:MAG: PIG-L family deacetylase [Pseudomonadota bacterium]|nr:PIG-L family deacetylase [Pseudomonadota bacterium]
MTPQTLVLAAHPDDEVIGCGILLQRDSDAVVVVVTDGGLGADPARPELPQADLVVEREAESRAALARLGIPRVHFLGEPEWVFSPLAVLSRLRALFPLPPRRLYAHAIEDEHPDHAKVGALALILAQEWGVELWQYPVAPLYPLRPPDRVLQAGAEEQARKDAALLDYRTQRHVTRHFRGEPERYWRAWPLPEERP